MTFLLNTSIVTQTNQFDGTTCCTEIYERKTEEKVMWYKLVSGLEIEMLT